MLGDREFVDLKFKVLLDDAAFFLGEAERTLKDKSGEDPRTRLARRWNSYARASLINSSLLLECVANILIDTLELGAVAFGAIDRLRVVDKFAYYLEIKHPTERIDKLAPWYKEAEELVNFRNALVHSKPHYGEWRKINETTVQAQIGETPLLKLPYSLLAIEAPEALSSLRVALKFLNYYFLNLCKYSSHQTHSLLITDWGSRFTAYDRSWFEWVESWNLPMEFLVDIPEIKKIEEQENLHFQNIRASDTEPTVTQHTDTPPSQ